MTDILSSPKFVPQSITAADPIAETWRPGDACPAGFVIANADGLPARSQGPWAQDKLRFLEEYLSPAVGATRKMRRQTYYIDLFAGPGRNSTPEKGQITADFAGSPILALRSAFKFAEEDQQQGFGYFHFCNVAALDHEFLHRRVVAEIPKLGRKVLPQTIHLHLCDSNTIVHEILAAIPHWAYIVAFVDIEGPGDLSMETVRALKRFHTSVDLYILYPTGLGLGRLFPYDHGTLEKHRALLNDYYGTPAWWDIVQARKSGGQAQQMKTQLLELYRSELNKVWKHAKIMMPVKKGESALYHMILAYDHDAAGSIAASAKRRSSQYGLLDELS